jgi:hypothetical protein
MIFIEIVVLNYNKERGLLEVRSLPGAAHRIADAEFKLFTFDFYYSSGFLRDAWYMVMVDARTRLGRLKRDRLLKSLYDCEISFRDFQRQVKGTYK